MRTAAEKLACAEREIAKRKRVFARLVEGGRMSQKKMDYEISTMQEIADDYRHLAASEDRKGDLFGSAA